MKVLRQLGWQEAALASQVSSLPESTVGPTIATGKWTQAVSTLMCAACRRKIPVPS